MRKVRLNLVFLCIIDVTSVASLVNFYSKKEGCGTPPCYLYSSPRRHRKDKDLSQRFSNKKFQGSGSPDRDMYKTCLSLNTSPQTILGLYFICCRSVPPKGLSSGWLQTKVKDIHAQEHTSHTCVWLLCHMM